MRILIADDAGTIPPVAEPPPPRRGRAAARKLQKPASAAEPFTLVCEMATPPMAGAPAAIGAPDEDGCEFPGPIPACPPLDLRDQPELLAAALDALGLALLNRGCIKEGGKLIRQALEIRLAHFGDKHPATAASFNSIARVYRLEDNLIGAEKEVNRALKINLGFFGSRGLPVAINLNELGAIQLYLGKFADAVKSARDGQKILDKLGLAATDPNWTRLLDVEGRALLEMNKLPDAEEVLAEAVKIDKAQVGDKHPKYATHLANLATVRWMRKDFVTARSDLSNAIDIYVNVVKLAGHPNLIDMYANLGSVLVNLGCLTDAKDYLCRALGLNRQLRGAGHTLVGNDHANLGRLYFRMGDQSRARAQFDKALRIYQQNVTNGTLPRRHPYILEAQEWMKKIPGS
jgi:tetratricopeptide (TPR) repeat protein